MIVLTCFAVIFSTEVIAQQNETVLNGNVSYITGLNIYVKFENTRGIENGDTLYIQKDNLFVPVLHVNHHSSISCLCKSISENTLKVGDEIFAKIAKAEDTEEIQLPPEVTVEKDVTKTTIDETLQTKNQEHPGKQNISGRISLSSYSNLSNARTNDSHRFRYTFSMHAENISDSKLSAEAYISFTHKLDEWELVQENLNSALKVYSLAINYKVTPTATVWLGRKINPNVANIGAVDGAQFQKNWKGFYTGIVVGTRPDYIDYGFNPELLEYGAYIGHNTKTKHGFAQSSLAIFEQRNNGNTDRRFIYFQHSNVLLKNVSSFASFELDLYQLENGEPSSTLSLTGLYLSLRYRVSRKLSLFGSYDNRKNVIYYETFRNYTDEILQQASRQGFRTRILYRPIKYLNLGLSAGTRNRKGDPRPTNTLRAYSSYTRLPVLNASLSLSANFTQTSYLDGQVYGVRLSKDWMNGKLYSMLNFRQVVFDYVTTSTQLKQQIGELDVAYRFNKKLYLSLNFESTFQDKITYNRLYVNIRQKF